MPDGRLRSRLPRGLDPAVGLVAPPLRAQDPAGSTVVKWARRPGAGAWFRSGVSASAKANEAGAADVAADVVDHMDRESSTSASSRRPNWRRTIDNPRVPRGGPDRPHAHRDRADRSRTRRTPVGRAPGTRGALQRGGQLANRRHPSHVHPQINHGIGLAAGRDGFPPKRAEGNAQTTSNGARSSVGRAAVHLRVQPVGATTVQRKGPGRRQLLPRYLLSWLPAS